MILSSVNFVKTSSRQPKSHFDFSDFIIGKIKEEQDFNDRCNKCGSPSEHVSYLISVISTRLHFTQGLMMKYSLQDAKSATFIISKCILHRSMKYSSFHLGLRQIY